MRGFLADVEFMWGFQSGIVGMSKSTPSFLLPPPSTVLGAIAEAYARRKGLSEGRSPITICYLTKNLLVLTYKFLNAVPLSYQDLSRIIAVRVSGNVKYPSAQDPHGSFDAPARGKTILSSIDDKPPTLRIFAVFRDSADVTADDLWRVRRIGTKESLVSVIDVIEEKPEVLKREVVETDYLLPLTPEIERSLSDRSEFLELEFISIYNLTSCEPPIQQYLEGKTLKHIISVPPTTKKARVKLPTGYVGYKIREEVAVGIEG
ncbi:MAG: type I-A CRISPR-associated protein Cas5a [Desulfurococcaceae archaeon]